MFRRKYLELLPTVPSEKWRLKVPASKQKRTPSPNFEDVHTTGDETYLQVLGGNVENLGVEYGARIVDLTNKTQN